MQIDLKLHLEILLCYKNLGEVACVFASHYQTLFDVEIQHQSPSLITQPVETLLALYFSDFIYTSISGCILELVVGTIITT